MRRSAICFLGCGALFALMPAAVHGATPPGSRPVSEYEVKALFLIRFVEYVSWPESAFADAQEPFVIGVLGRNPFENHLDAVARISVAQHRSLVIRYGRNMEELGACHLVFVAASEMDRSAAIAQWFARKPVLLVADGPGGIKAGLALEFRLQDKKVRFAVNTDNARNHGLKLRASLLSSAVEVVQVPTPSSGLKSFLRFFAAVSP